MGVLADLERMPVLPAATSRRLARALREVAPDSWTVDVKGRVRVRWSDGPSHKAVWKILRPKLPELQCGIRVWRVYRSETFAAMVFQLCSDGVPRDVERLLDDAYRALEGRDFDIEPMSATELQHGALLAGIAHVEGETVGLYRRAAGVAVASHATDETVEVVRRLLARRG